jgi:biopolymer transport protein ExbB/TolQ
MLINSLEKFALMGASWVLYLLVVLSMISIGIMVERWSYFRRHAADVDGLADGLVRRLRTGDRRGAEELLTTNRSIEAQVLRPVLAWIDGGPDSVAEALEASMLKKRAELERGVTFLGTLGNNAPFVGLFGTVVGVIQAFHMLGQGGAGQSQAAMGNVMVGISEALIATGVGLLVALPAVVAYNVAQKQVNQIETNVTVIGKQVLALLKADAKLIREFKLLDEALPHESELSPEPPEAQEQDDGVPATELS